MTIYAKQIMIDPANSNDKEVTVHLLFCSHYSVDSYCV